MRRDCKVSRRTVMGAVGAAAIAGFAGAGRVRAQNVPVRFALTPVLLTSDLVMLEELKKYLARAVDRPVQLVTRRTYQEITALLLTRQVDAAWICGYPYVAYRSELALVAVPLWNGKPLYQSYLIGRTDLEAETIADLAGTIHAFSDPDSNSGYLVTRSMLAELGTSPSRHFKQFFYTYGHRNVIRAVASGLATGGSVDGYVYDVLRDIEPDLVARTRIVRKSEFLGFPPIAAPVSEVGSATFSSLRNALTNMANDPQGKRVLAMLRLDGFSVERPELFDAIAAKIRLVRGAKD